MTTRPRRALRCALLPALLLAACTGFHEVVPGVYRDRQPAEDEMVVHIERHGIRTLVRLRGETPDTAPSRRAAWAMDVDVVDIPMSARRLPTKATLLRLWETLDRAERPLLFHCRAGVDRTGLASALAVLHDTGDLSAARRQLALLPYGHVPFGPTQAMDEVLQRFAATGGGSPFPDWVRDTYEPE
ncbi:MAG: tyrosine-protein phosphatase [Planctomycetota bacterium]